MQPGRPDAPRPKETEAGTDPSDLPASTHAAPEVAPPDPERAIQPPDVVPVTAVLTQPKHPYTVGLLHSTPAPGRRDARLRVLPGTPADGRPPPSGCPFALRCPQVMALCREREPPLKEVDGGARARCWLY